MANHRGLVRLSLSASAAGGRRRQLLLPIPWEPDQVDTIRDAVLTLFDALQKGVELQEELERIPASKLRGSRNRIKIKLRAAGFRLVVEVLEHEVLVLVVAVGKRERNAVDRQADQR